MAYGNSANNVSSPVSLSKVTQVFDGVATGNLRNYLRGSLPYPVTNAYSSIAASGTLSLLSFASANNPPAILPVAGVFLWDSAVGGDASVQITVSSGGNFLTYEGGANQSNDLWLYAGSVVDYDVKFIQTGKTGLSSYFSGPTVNTWHVCSSSRFWQIEIPGGGFRSASWNGFLELRMNASPQTIIANCTISMSCDTEI